MNYGFINKNSLCIDTGSYGYGFSPNPNTFKYEPETIGYMNTANILNDDTIYLPSTIWQKTGAEWWTYLNDYVLSVKLIYGLPIGVSSLSTQFRYLYVRLGGNATACAINLVTGLNGGSFVGGWTINGGACTPNGLNGYFQANVPYTIANFPPSNSSFGFISKTNIQENRVDFGVLTGGYGNLIMYGRNASGNIITRLNTGGGNNQQAISSSLGMLSMNRIDGSTYKTYLNGVSLGSITDPSTTYGGTSFNIFEASYNSAGIIGGQYSTKSRTIFWGGLGMTDQQMLALHTASQTFELNLNR